MHLSDDLVIVEPVDENDEPVPCGVESAKIHLTNFFNPLLPLIRYEITDQVNSSTTPAHVRLSEATISGLAPNEQATSPVDHRRIAKRLSGLVCQVPKHHARVLQQQQGGSGVSSSHAACVAGRPSRLRAPPSTSPAHAAMRHS